MSEKDQKKYLKYCKAKQKDKFNFIQKIMYFNFLKDDYEWQINIAKSKSLLNSIYQEDIEKKDQKIKILEQRIKQLNHDLKEKK